MAWWQARIQGVGSEIPSILLLLVKLNAVAIFIWYSWELLLADYGELRLVNFLVGLSLAIFVIFVLKIAWNPPEIPAGQAAVGHYYLLLVLAPLLAVAFLTVMYPQDQDFKSPLIKATAEHMRSVWSWISR